MVFTSENILLLGAILVFISILVSKTGYKFGIPTLLLFLVVGMIFGSDGLGLQFNSPESAQFIGMVALSVILFSGGMETKINDIKPVLVPGLILSTFALVITTALTGVFIYTISAHTEIDIELTLLGSLLLAATMSSTDSASVFSILRSQKMRLKNNLKPLLELESGSNDPMAYMLTIILIQIIQHPDKVSAWSILGELVMQFGIAIITSIIIGKGIVWIINKINLSNTALYSVLLLSIVFVTFSITDLFGGNGYLAVYICGVVVGNSKVVLKREMSNFLDSLTWLFQTIMFLALGLLVNPLEMVDIAVVGLLIGLFMIFAARPISIFICLAPFRKLNFRSKIFTSWVGLRGAAPIIFATYPVVAGVHDSNIIFNIVFFITLLSLIFQGMSLAWSAKILNLELPPEQENEFDIQIPEEMGSSLYEVKLTDKMLEKGNTLAKMSLPDKHLAIMIKRGKKYIIPNGTLELKKDDIILFMSQTEHQPE